MAVAAVAVAFRAPGTLLAARMERFRRPRRRARRGGLRSGSAALDDLVELAAVEPHPAALRAIVDLDPLAVAHRQRHAADRALHRGDFGFGAHWGPRWLLGNPKWGLATGVQAAVSNAGSSAGQSSASSQVPGSSSS